jgi:hypothetical protein
MVIESNIRRMIRISQIRSKEKNVFVVTAEEK